MAFDPQTTEKIRNAKVFMVGAGGIGCELLKNLLLTGFRNIELIDLDTIEVSNLNRQFLFRSEHVGKSKAEVAAKSAQEMCPEARIVWHHDSVMKSDYNVKFFGRFDLVMNALDNVTARSHVNRMCLAANVPLIESGSAGYLGNCKVILKGKTECFDCQPPVAQKSFPGCTIRNTPSEPIHCIVWAKHLFNQLFGEADPDQDVSPDTDDPSLQENGTPAQENGMSDAKPKENGTTKERLTTRALAVKCNYNPEHLFQKLFNTDILYLLSMEKLWEKRRKPSPLTYISSENGITNGGENGTHHDHEDKKVWSLKENIAVFTRAVEALKNNLDNLGNLVWDKDEDDSMDFVTACANLRAVCFGIPIHSRYDVKQMAGNIIPAIASANAMVAGFIIFNAIKLLQGKAEECRNVISKIFRDTVPDDSPKRRFKVVAPSSLQPPSETCVSCSDKVEVDVSLNVDTMAIKDFQDIVLKGYLRMTAPDVALDDPSGTIVISSEDEGLRNKDKPLVFFKVKDGSRLKCEDFVQEYSIVLNIHHQEQFPEGTQFQVLGEGLKKVQEAQKMAAEESASSGTKRKTEEENGDRKKKPKTIAGRAAIATEVMDITD